MLLWILAYKTILKKINNLPRWWKINSQRVLIRADFEKAIRLILIRILWCELLSCSLFTGIPDMLPTLCRQGLTRTTTARGPPPVTHYRHTGSSDSSPNLSSPPCPLHEKKVNVWHHICRFPRILNPVFLLRNVLLYKVNSNTAQLIYTITRLSHEKCCFYPPNLITFLAIRSPI